VIKVNTYGAIRATFGFAVCGGIFKGSRGEYLCSFSALLDIQYVLYVEVMSVIFFLLNMLISRV